MYDFSKKYNLTVPTVWMGRITKMNKNGAYEWSDGQLGRYGAGFRGGKIYLIQLTVITIIFQNHIQVQIYV